MRTRRPGNWLSSAKAAGLALLAAAALAPSRALSAPGETSMDFLRLDVGPRQIAMGGVGAALGGDAYSTAYNPALLADLRSREAAFSHAQWFQDIRYQDFFYAQPVPAGGLSFRFQRLGYGSIPSYDAAGARTGEISPSDILAGASYARRVRKSLLLGGSFKAGRESLGPASAGAYMFDLGAAYFPSGRSWAEDTTLGFSLRNLGNSVKFDRDSQPLPSEAVFGVSRRLLDETLVLAADGHFPRKQGPYGGLGLELCLAETLYLRAGSALLPDEGPGIRAGFGFRYDRVRVDYAFAPMGDLGQTHHVGIRVLFGGPADKAYDEGMRLLRGERYPEAVLKFNETMNLDPKHPKAAMRLKQAYERTKEQGLETGGR